MRRAFSTLLMDPPWPEKGGTPLSPKWGGGKRGADAQYAVVKVHELPEIIQRSPLWSPAPDAHLYMWVTDTYLQEALWLMRVLGFKYRRQLVWPKNRDQPNRVGLGQYFRTKHEVCLFGVRGDGYAVYKPNVPGHPASTLIEERAHAGKRVHSRKPIETYEKIEARSKGPYAELFCRGTPRAGWAGWGLECEIVSPDA